MLPKYIPWLVLYSVMTPDDEEWLINVGGIIERACTYTKCDCDVLLLDRTYAWIYYRQVQMFIYIQVYIPFSLIFLQLISLSWDLVILLYALYVICSSGHMTCHSLPVLFLHYFYINLQFCSFIINVSEIFLSIFPCSTLVIS